MGQDFEVNDQWAVPAEDWFSVGDDCVFTCHDSAGHARSFHLRDDFFSHILDVTLTKSPPPWTGLLSAYCEGLGRWGDAPWLAPDFKQALAQLELAADSQLRHEFHGDQISAARRDLVDFLRARQRAGDSLTIDDGTGLSNRFPEAEESWTETGRPEETRTLVAYQEDPEEACGYTFETFEIAQKTLESARLLGVEKGLQLDFMDIHLSYKRIENISALMKSLKMANIQDSSLLEFVGAAFKHGKILIVQSGALFPLAAPSLPED